MCVGGVKEEGRSQRQSEIRQMGYFLTDGKDMADDALTWGSTLCSSCSCSCTGGGEGGSRPECEQGCARWSEEAWEPPAAGAGRAQPRREWQAGWGRRRRLWGGTGLETQTRRQASLVTDVLC